MADHSSPNYKDLYLQAEEARKQEEERRRQEEKRRKQAEEREKQAEEREKQEAKGRRQAEERNQKTSFTELLQHCHDLLSCQLRVETPSRSTTGKIPLPTGKDCPTRLEHWADCPEQLLRVYRSVYQYLQSESGQAPRFFSSLPEQEGLGRRLARKPLSSEQDLEAYERFGVEEHVHDIIAELCKLPAACDEFSLGDGIQFSNHTNSLSRNEAFEADPNELSSIPHSRPDQFCIHRVADNTNILMTTVEYKPPHKLPVATLRMGLRPMDLWKEMVRSNKIPTDQDAKLRYNAERLVCSAIVQEYHVMIQEGLEYSYLTNGIARVLLRVPRDDPTTLHYFLCDPQSDVHTAADTFSQLSKTSVARVLCLYLMAFRSPARGQEWIACAPFISGKRVLSIRDRKSRGKNYSRFPTPIARILSFRVQILARPMNCRRHLRYRLPQRAVERLHDLKPAVHLHRFDRARNHLTHPDRTQIKQLALQIKPP